MALVKLYFDSGFGGTIPAEEWAEIVSWASLLPPGEYPALGCLLGEGWCDDLDELEADLDEAADTYPPDAPTSAALALLTAALNGRDEADEVAALKLVETPGPVDKGVANEWIPLATYGPGR